MQEDMGHRLTVYHFWQALTHFRAALAHFWTTLSHFRVALHNFWVNRKAVVRWVLARSGGTCHTISCFAFPAIVLTLSGVECVWFFKRFFLF